VILNSLVAGHWIEQDANQPSVSLKCSMRVCYPSAPMKVLSVVGARPNLMKISSLVTEIRMHPEIQHVLVHTGQHYDQSMSQQFFDDLGIPRPDINLNVGSASDVVQTAEIMKRFEPVVMENPCDVVVVVGDVNSTLACALTAKKLGTDVAHVEAGLRSFDRSMPEETNRLLTDAISDVLFVSEESGERNLLREGIDPKKIFFVGNVMIDTLLRHREKAEQSTIRTQLGPDFESGRYVLLTLHRPSNVDNPAVLQSLLKVFQKLSSRVRIAFPVHPRTRKNVENAGLQQYFESDRLLALSPMGYLDFLNLMSHALLVITDSGGIQEETTVLGVPCLTVRGNTERPVTIKEGTNQLVGVDPEKILEKACAVVEKGFKPRGVPKFWDGRASERILTVLFQHYGA
jgi:UDP-N-acetylglucosamine 2-epimerase (non-hydrolysing)